MIRSHELEEEIAFHLEQRTEEYVRLGMPREAAVRRARHQFGSVSHTRDAMRNADTLPWLDRLCHDVHHAVRALRRDPGFAIVASLTLALGIGANTAMFTLANALLLKPLVARAPADLLALSAREDGNDVPLLATMVDHIRDERVFDGLCGFLTLSVTTELGGRTAPLQVHPMTGDCFPVLGRWSLHSRGRGPHQSAGRSDRRGRGCRAGCSAGG